MESEPRINAIDKKLIIECATTGPSVRFWEPRDMYPIEPPFYKEGEIRFAALPCTIEEQATPIIDAIKAGAAAIYHHAVDPERTKASYAPELQTEIFDRVR